MPIDLRFDPNEIPLLTDLYELTMAASYFALGFNRPACFGMSVRRLRPLSFVSIGIVAVSSGITYAKLQHST
jgi:nicotinic acid phosphoribosyltransferase